MKKKISTIVIAIVAILAGVVYAKNGNALGYQVVSENDEVVLKVTVDTPAPGMWLGVTLYPPNVKNTAKEGKVKLLPLKKGRAIYEVAIEPGFRFGSFEAAVWTKKTPAEECTAAETYCKSIGYKLTGMRSYIWGYLVP